MTTSKARNHSNASDGLRTEYDLDYGRSRRNRFASRMSGTTPAVVLEPDAARVFDSSVSVNRGSLRRVLSSIGSTSIRTYPDKEPTC